MRNDDLNQKILEVINERINSVLDATTIKSMVDAALVQVCTVPPSRSSYDQPRSVLDQMIAKALLERIETEIRNLPPDLLSEKIVSSLSDQFLNGVELPRLVGDVVRGLVSPILERTRY